MCGNGLCAVNDTKPSKRLYHLFKFNADLSFDSKVTRERAIAVNR